MAFPTTALVALTLLRFTLPLLGHSISRVHEIDASRSRSEQQAIAHHGKIPLILHHAFLDGYQVIFL